MDHQAPRRRRTWPWIWALVLCVLLYALSGFSRSLGLQPVWGCPSQSLSPEEVQAAYEKGLALTERDMMGEHHLGSSIAEGLPFIKRAAKHGYLPAIDALGGHYIRHGAVEMLSFDGLSSPDATAEGMMWSILEVHLGAPVQPHDEATYRVLLDPDIPFPEGFFNSASGTAWTFQMLTDWGLEWAREQAYAWRGCW